MCVCMCFIIIILLWAYIIPTTKAKIDNTDYVKGEKLVDEK